MARVPRHSPEERRSLRARDRRRPEREAFEVERRSRRPRDSSTSSGRKSSLLARLTPDESAGVLRALLERHPGLVVEAEALAAATVTDVDAQAVADDVEEAMLGLDID